MNVSAARQLKGDVQNQTSQLNILASFCPVQRICEVIARRRDQDDLTRGKVGVNEANGSGNFRGMYVHHLAASRGLSRPTSYPFDTGVPLITTILGVTDSTSPSGDKAVSGDRRVTSGDR